jgi:hypothetical protein
VSASYSIGGYKPQADFSGMFMKAVFILFAIGVSASMSLQASDIHQSRGGSAAPGGRVLASGARTITHGFYYNGYRPGEVQADRGPLVVDPRSRQNQAGAAQDTTNDVAKARAKDSGRQLNGANLSAVSPSLSSSQGSAQRRINLPPGVKPQVATPAERSQAAANINQKFQQAENKMANQLWRTPDSRTNRRNRLEQCRAYFIGLLDWGYPLSLLDTWCDDLLDDQVDVGMPNDLIDSYWGQPVSTQDYEEYYSPYEACTYLTPDGNYRQVIYQNGVVAQAM